MKHNLVNLADATRLQAGQQSRAIAARRRDEHVRAKNCVE
jgi:hypothetical protein